MFNWLVWCFWFNGPLRQYCSPYWAVSQREEGSREKGKTREKMSKQSPPVPTASAAGTYTPFIIQISKDAQALEVLPSTPEITV